MAWSFRKSPDQPDFWEKIYREGDLPWDAGSVPRALEEFLRREKQSGRVLVPGCGSAYEARAFAEAGWDVTAIDFAPAAVERARKILGGFSRRVRLADFFKSAPKKPFDLVYERAFLCALPRRRWAEYGRRMAEIIRPGGRLVGFFFYKRSLFGPPFGLKEGQLQGILGPAFERRGRKMVPSTKKVFGKTESWEVWERSSP
jgi:SAM-dependent methyltransferase